MTALTSRQKRLLRLITDKYIERAQPVSSLQLSAEYDFDICPATIRNEMISLTKNRYLFQPHSSSGRVPTNKGYNFLVQEIISDELKTQQSLLSQLENFREELQNTITFVQRIVKEFAHLSDCLAMSYSLDRDFLCEDGWKELMFQPEFRDGAVLRDFIKLVKETEKKIGGIFSQEEFNKIRVFIGRDNPISSSDQFSLIICKARFPKSKKGNAIAMLGPKRMAYKKNLCLLYTAFNFFDNL